jgi:hypothetical protein
MNLFRPSGNTQSIRALEGDGVMACTRSLTQPLRWLLLTAAIGLLAACGGGGGGYGGGSANTGGGGGGGGAMLEATFDSIQANVFTPICTACHIGAAAPQGLRRHR